MKQTSAVGKINIRENIPLFIALLATFIPVILIEAAILRGTNGVFMYPLDDPFIHMQVARNFSFFGVWGINPHEFGSASSSLLYTLILSGVFKLFSTHVAIPFVINCIAAVFLLGVIHRWLQQQQVRLVARTMILLLVVILVPLPILIISGMEHTLQCLFTFLFLTRFSSWLQVVNEKDHRKKLPWSLIIYALLVVSIRYEGLFIIAIACLLLAYHRKIMTAVQLMAIAVLPVLIFGIYSVLHGSYFLPNSVLVKTDGPQSSLHGMMEFLNNVFVYKLTTGKTGTLLPGSPPPGISLLVTQRLLIILPLTYLLFKAQIKQRAAYGHLLILLTLCTLVHLSFASTGWFYRYEAYLILCAVPIVSVVIYHYGKQAFAERTIQTWLLGTVLLFALFFPMILRTAAAFTKASRACINIYEQQYQAAQFIRTYYNKDTVAANDIGAISYYAKAEMVDLWGLGSIEVARSKKGKYWTPVFLDSLVRTKGVKVAIVYDDWFDKGLLDRWTKVATWQIQDNVITGGDTISFYAIDPARVPELKEQLLEFQRSLPPGVTVVYK